MQEKWDAEAAELERGLPHLGPYPVSGLIRRVRRRLDLSQRELARVAKVSQSTVARIESGAMTPTLTTFVALLALAGFHLVVVDGDGRIVQPMRDSDHTRDGADRRYPAHLDTILDPKSGEWWGDDYGLARPPETFRRDRARRDAERARSRWEVRASLVRGQPPPTDPSQWESFLGRLRQIEERPYVGPPLREEDFDVDEWDGDGDEILEG